METTVIMGILLGLYRDYRVYIMMNSGLGFWILGSGLEGKGEYVIYYYIGLI